MTRCHAFWSFGTVAGALIGGAFAERGIGFLTQQLILQPLFAAATIFFALRLIADDPAPARRSRSAASRCRRRRSSLMCLVPIGALLIEGAMMEWSALLMREWKGAGPFVTALTFSVFALAMAVIAAGRRPAGGAVRAAAGDPALGAGHGGRASSASALAPGLWLSLPAAALVGVGCGNIYPLTMSMVGQVPGPRPERNVATLALVAFTAFLIGPPLIGALAHVVGLPVALALLAPLGLAPLALLLRPARRAASAAVDAGDGVGLVDGDVQPVLAVVHRRRRGREEHAGAFGQVDVVQHVDALADPVLVRVGGAGAGRARPAPGTACCSSAQAPSARTRARPRLLGGCGHGRSPGAGRVAGARQARRGGRLARAGHSGAARAHPGSQAVDRRWRNAASKRHRRANWSGRGDRVSRGSCGCR